LHWPCVQPPGAAGLRPRNRTSRECCDWR
jgi:hypothetical protein